MRNDSRPVEPLIRPPSSLLPAEPLMLALISGAIYIVIALAVGRAFFAILPSPIAIPAALAIPVGLSFVLHAGTWHVITAVGIVCFTVAWAGASILQPAILPEVQFRDTAQWQTVTLGIVVSSLVIDRLFRLRPPSVITRIAATVIVFQAALVLLLSWPFLEPASRATTIAACALYAVAVGFSYVRAWQRVRVGNEI